MERGRPRHSVATASDQSQTEVPPPWQDRLTKLINRQGFDTTANEWLHIEKKHRKKASLTMFRLSDYTQLLEKHGAIVTEQAIRSVASHLAKN